MAVAFAMWWGSSVVVLGTVVDTQGSLFGNSPKPVVWSVAVDVVLKGDG